MCLPNRCLGAGSTVARMYRGVFFQDVVWQCIDTSQYFYSSSMSFPELSGGINMLMSSLGLETKSHCAGEGQEQFSSQSSSMIYYSSCSSSEIGLLRADCGISLIK
jgi:hypothetical protein